jgi:hypothetical protein
MSTGGEVANALVCKTSIRGFNSLPVLQLIFNLCGDASRYDSPLHLSTPLLMGLDGVGACAFAL